MPLHKIKDFDPNYQQHFGDRDILKFDVYSDTQKVGSVDDLLVDEAGQFRYFVINTGAWIVSKKVLLPIGRTRIDEKNRCVYVDGLTRDQVKNLPEYQGETIDYDYEERVRGIYRPANTTRTVPVTHDRHSYRYDHDPDLYTMNERDHSLLRRSEAHMMSGRPIAGKHRRAIGVFPNRQAAEHALHELRDSGFPMGRVSVVTRDADKHDEIAGADVRDRVGNKADEGATIGAVSGGTLGGLTGLLVGLGTLAIPGVGPIMLAGATATALATTLAGGAIGAVSGGLIGALVGLGIPEERARVYHDRISRGGYLVIVDGTDAEIARAESILHRRGIEDYGVYDAPTTHTSTAHTSAHAHDGSSTAPIAHTATVPGQPITADASRSPLGRRSAVGFFSNLSDAESATTDLRSAGFPLSQITLVANNFQHRDRFTGINLHDRFDNNHFGLPEERLGLFNNRIARGDYLVVIQGTKEQLSQAEAILNRSRIQDFAIYDATDLHSTQQTPASVERHTAPDLDPTRRDDDARIEQPHPNVTIVDRRDETRRS